MKVGKRQQQGRGDKTKEICPLCHDYYLQPFYGNDHGLKPKGVYCPNDSCTYCKKDSN